MKFIIEITIATRPEGKPVRAPFYLTGFAISDQGKVQAVDYDQEIDNAKRFTAERDANLVAPKLDRTARVILAPESIKLSRRRFTFYRDNRLDDTFTLTGLDLSRRFVEWMDGREVAWLSYYQSLLVRAFVSSPDGLGSTLDDNHWTRLEETLRDVKFDYTRNMHLTRTVQSA